MAIELPKLSHTTTFDNINNFEIFGEYVMQIEVKIIDFIMHMCI